ncbi:hypothetical protein [Streptomyces sp. CB01635]|uniref:hypothetical protein n=1 Tax=Streptomyces sp. CB01635 TaxID=2020326 RepID=UPI00131D1C25|nr:hypothetical protein [Streptomyces sp. CB01635]
MATLAVSRCNQLPFGELRAEQADTIPGTRGYVGGTTDPTGLNHLGARKYDPSLADAVDEHARWASRAASKNPRHG